MEICKAVGCGVRGAGPGWGRTGAMGAAVSEDRPGQRAGAAEAKRRPGGAAFVVLQRWRRLRA